MFAAKVSALNFCLTSRSMILRGVSIFYTTVNLEYFGENKTKFKNI